MQDIDTPGLLIPGAQSPHFFQLKPSDLRKLHRADVVFWIGATLERPLERILNTLSGTQQQVAMVDTPGLTLRHSRTHQALSPAQPERDRVPASSDAPTLDPHIWLSANNARAMVDEIAAVLATVDLANARKYQENARLVQARIDRLDRHIEHELAAVKTSPFVVYHDAYGYFEQAYGLKSLAAIAPDSERKPGARHLHRLNQLLAEYPGVCVFSEAQGDPRLVENLASDARIRSAQLDPLGRTIEPGPEAWFELMRDIAGSLRRCLQP